MASWEEISEKGKSQVDSSGKKEIFGMVDFSQVSTDEKLNLIMAVMNKLYNSFNTRLDRLDNFHDAVMDEEDGLLVKINNAQLSIGKMEQSVAGLDQSNKKLKTANQVVVKLRIIPIELLKCKKLPPTCTMMSSF